MMRAALALSTHLIVLATASLHLRTTEHVSAVELHKTFKGTAHSLPKRAVMDGIMALRGAMGDDESPEHDPQLFLEFDVLGDLTNVRECIVNAAILCHSLGLTLVLPSSYNSTYRSINLAEVYDLKRFQSGLAEVGIPVVWERPEAATRYTLSIPSVISQPTHRFQQVVDAFRSSVDEHKGEFATFWAPGTSDELNIGFHIFESRYVSACKADMPICGHIQSSLVHSEVIRKGASLIAQAMTLKSHDWTAMHLHDFEPFLCNYSTATELFYAAKLLGAAEWKPGPMYLVSGRRDSKQAAASLQGWDLSDKWSIMDTSAFEFQYGAAVDFEVALRAPRYIGKRGSSFDTFAMELREAAGLHPGHVLYLPQNPCAQNFKKEVAEMQV